MHAAQSPPVVANLPWHIIQRGNNRQAFFYPHEDCQACLRWLGEAPKKAASALHA